MTPLIPVLGRTLTPATTGSPLNFLSLSQAALAGRTTTRAWNQVVREGIAKTAADKAAAGKAAAGKAATDKATAETQRRIYEEEWPSYGGPDISSASPLPDDHSEFPGAPFICFPKELGDRPWNDSDDDWYSSPPPPIPFLVDMEMEANVAQSNKDVKLWLSKF